MQIKNRWKALFTQRTDMTNDLRTRLPRGHSRKRCHIREKNGPKVYSGTTPTSFNGTPTKEKMVKIGP